MEPNPEHYAAFAEGRDASKPAELIQKSETAAARHSDRLFTHKQPTNELSPGAGVERKQFETLRATLALAGGHAIHELADGSFLVTWRHLSRAFPDLNAVAASAHQVGAAK